MSWIARERSTGHGERAILFQLPSFRFPRFFAPCQPQACPARAAKIYAIVSVTDKARVSNECRNKHFTRTDATGLPVYPAFRVIKSEHHPRTALDDPNPKLERTNVFCVRFTRKSYEVFEGFERLLLR